MDSAVPFALCFSGGHLFWWGALWVGDGRRFWRFLSRWILWWRFIWIKWPETKHVDKTSPYSSNTKHDLWMSSWPVIHWVAVVFGHGRAAGLRAWGWGRAWGGWLLAGTATLLGVPLSLLLGRQRRPSPYGGEWESSTKENDLPEFEQKWLMHWSFDGSCSNRPPKK